MSYRATLNLVAVDQNARYFVSGSYLDEGGMYKVDKSLNRDYNAIVTISVGNCRMNADIDVTRTTLFAEWVSVVR